MIELPFALRPVLGMPDSEVTRFMATFGRAAERRDFSKGERRSLMLNKYAGRVTLLGTGHLQHFLRAHGIKPEQADGEELADHLEDTLPPRFDECITKPVLPSEVFVAGDRKRALLIGVCPELVEERQLIRGAIASFYGVQPTPDSWPRNDLPGGYEIAYTSHVWSDDVIDLAQTTLRGQVAGRPREVTYHPLAIDMVPCDFQ
jgi:hypothetical protein